MTSSSPLTARLTGAAATASCGLAIGLMPLAPAAALSPVPPPYVELIAVGNGPRADVLVVKVSRRTAGGTIQIVRTRSESDPGVILKSKTLTRFGTARFRVADRNGPKATTYRAILIGATGEYEGAVSMLRKAR